MEFVSIPSSEAPKDSAVDSNKMVVIPKPLLCMVCGQTFSSHSDLQQHTAIHKKEKPFECSFCDMRYKDFHEFSNHLRTLHSRRPFQLKVGNVHFNNCENENQTEQDYLFNNSNDSQNTVTIQEANQYQCTFCSDVLLKQQQFLVHIRQHIGNTFKCNYCEKRFPREDLRHKHLRRVHVQQVGGKKSKTSVDADGIEFFYKNQTREKSTDGITDPILDTVSVRVTDDGSVLIVENKEDECPDVTDIHPGQNPESVVQQHPKPTKVNVTVQCAFCNKSFHNKHNYEEHVLIHTGEKPYACVVCDVRYRQRSAVIRHMKNTHKDFKGGKAFRKVVDQNSGKTSSVSEGVVVKNGTSQTRNDGEVLPDVENGGRVDFGIRPLTNSGCFVNPSNSVGGSGRFEDSIAVSVAGGYFDTGYRSVAVESGGISNDVSFAPGSGGFVNATRSLPINVELVENAVPGNGGFLDRPARPVSGNKEFVEPDTKTVVENAGFIDNSVRSSNCETGQFIDMIGNGVRSVVNARGFLDNNFRSAVEPQGFVDNSFNLVGALGFVGNRFLSVTDNGRLIDNSGFRSVSVTGNGAVIDNSNRTVARNRGIIENGDRTVASIGAVIDNGGRSAIGNRGIIDNSNRSRTVVGNGGLIDNRVRTVSENGRTIDHGGSGRTDAGNEVGFVDNGVFSISVNRELPKPANKYVGRIGGFIDTCDREMDCHDEGDDMCNDDVETSKACRTIETATMSQCTFCHEKFPNKSILREHILIHTFENLYACVLCEMRFAQRDALDRHMKNEHEEQDDSNNKVLTKHDIANPDKRIRDSFTYSEGVFLKKGVLIRLNDSQNEDKEVKRVLSKESKKVKRLFQCKICDRVCSTGLQEHMRLHTGERPFECQVCGKKFRLNTHKKEHINKFHKEYSSAVSKASDSHNDADVTGKTDMSKHPDDLLVNGTSKLMQGKSGGIVKRFECTFCSTSFFSRSDFAKHTRQHTGDQPFRCGLCESNFVLSSSLKRHMRNIHAGCPVHRMVNTSLDLSEDKLVGDNWKVLLINESVESRSVPLEETTNNVSNEDKLNIKSANCTCRMKKKSDGKKINSCTLCGKIFKQARYLHNHMKRHADGKMLPSTLCHKRFKQAQHLQDHMKRHAASRQKSFTCDLCGKCFSHSKTFWRHKRNMHVTHRVSKKGRTLKSVETPVNSKGGKPFKCILCERQFSLQLSLSRHLTTVHKGCRIDKKTGEIILSNGTKRRMECKKNVYNTKRPESSCKTSAPNEACNSKSSSPSKWNSDNVKSAKEINTQETSVTENPILINKNSHYRPGLKGINVVDNFDERVSKNCYTVDCVISKYDARMHNGKVLDANSNDEKTFNQSSLQPVEANDTHTECAVSSSKDLNSSNNSEVLNAAENCAGLASVTDITYSRKHTFVGQSIYQSDKNSLSYTRGVRKHRKDLPVTNSIGVNCRVSSGVENESVENKDEDNNVLSNNDNESRHRSVNSNNNDNEKQKITKLYQCTVCNEIISTQQSLEDHIMKVHENEEPCNKVNDSSHSRHDERKRESRIDKITIDNELVEMRMSFDVFPNIEPEDEEKADNDMTENDYLGEENFDRESSELPLKWILSNEAKNEILPKRAMFSKDPQKRLYKIFRCNFCSQIFSYKSVLQRHLIKQHKECVSRSRLSTPSFSKSRRSDGVIWTKHVIMISQEHPSVKSEDLEVDKEKEVISENLSTEMRESEVHENQTSSLSGDMEVIEYNSKDDCKTMCKGIPQKESINRQTLISKLKKRIALHSSTLIDVKKYACRFCAEKFKYKSACSRHMRTVHKSRHPIPPFIDDNNGDGNDGVEDVKKLSGELPESKKEETQCPVCQKRFTTKSYLYNHMMVHSGEKPYACKFCGKKFRHMSTRNRHTRTVHKDGSCVIALDDRDFSYVRESKDLLVKSREEQKRLMQQEELSSSYQCSVCEKLFVSHSCLQKHKLTHVYVKVYTCKFCDKKFSKNSDCNIHMKTVHIGRRGEDFASDDDDILLGTKDLSTDGDVDYDQDEQSKSKKGDKQSYQCSLCNKLYSTQSYLRAHMMVHTGEKPYACSFCEKKFRHMSTRNRHMRTVHKVCKPVVAANDDDGTRIVKDTKDMLDNDDVGESLIRECSEIHMSSRKSKRRCNVCFKRCYNIQEHMLMHAGLRPIQCDFCHYRFRHFNSYRRHVQMIHKGQPVPTRRRSARLYAAVVDDIDKESFQCAGSEMTSSSQVLSTEAKDSVPIADPSDTEADRVVPEETDFSAFVEMSVNADDALRKEERLRKRGKGFQCTTCGKTFTQERIFEEHVRSHTGERPHKCDFCKKRFNYLRNVKRHMLYVHTLNSEYKAFRENIKMEHGGESTGPSVQSDTGAKNDVGDASVSEGRKRIRGEGFKCTVCGKTFKRELMLQEHIRLHTGERPHKCKFCGKSFNYLRNIKRHMLNVHTLNNESITLPEDERDSMVTATANQSGCETEKDRDDLLTLNQEKHKKGERFNCTMCDKSFSQERIFQEHNRSHTGERPHRCNLCGKSFNYFRNVRRHILTVHGTLNSQLISSREGKKLYENDEESVERKIDSKTYSSTVNENCQVNKDSPTTSVFDSPTKSNNSEAMDEKHTSSKEDSKKNRRNYQNGLVAGGVQGNDNDGRSGIDYVCQSQSMYERGSVDSASKEGKRSKCTICNKTFHSREYLKEHMTRHTGRKPFKCLLCDRRFNFQTSASRHVKVVHKGCDEKDIGKPTSNERTRNKIEGAMPDTPTPHRCYFCNQAFRTVAIRYRHVKKFHKGRVIPKTPKLPSMALCSVCGKLCAPAYTLKYHMSKHTDHRPYGCNHCQMKFKSKDSLGQHLKCRHRDGMRGETKAKIAELKCGVCDKAFPGTQQTRFEEHLRSHSEDTPFKCDFCHVKFKYESSIKAHLRVRNTRGFCPKKSQVRGEKRFECSVCGTRVSRKLSLDRHMMIHSGEKPYRCDYCGVMFRWSSTFRRHVRTVHKGRPIPQTSGVQVVSKSLGNPDAYPLTNALAANINTNSVSNIRGNAKNYAVIQSAGFDEVGEGAEVWTENDDSGGGSGGYVGDCEGISTISLPTSAPLSTFIPLLTPVQVAPPMPLSTSAPMPTSVPLPTSHPLSTFVPVTTAIALSTSISMSTSIPSTIISPLSTSHQLPTSVSLSRIPPLSSPDPQSAFSPMSTSLPLSVNRDNVTTSLIRGKTSVQFPLNEGDVEKTSIYLTVNPERVRNLTLEVEAESSFAYGFPANRDRMLESSKGERHSISVPVSKGDIAKLNSNRENTSDDLPAMEDNVTVTDSVKDREVLVGKRKWKYDKMIPCTFCGKMFRRCNLPEHMLRHTGEKPHKCHLCEERYRQRSALLRHWKNAHNIMRKPDVLFGDKNEGQNCMEEALRRKGKKNGGRLGQIFQCVFCDRKCYGKQEFQEHVRSHTGEVPYQCDFCHARYKYLSSIRRHLKIKELRGTCPVFRKTVVSESSAKKKDKERKVRDVKHFQCRVCGEALTRKVEYWEHLRLHAGEKQFQCDHCGLTFMTSEDLLQHINTSHEGCQTSAQTQIGEHHLGTSSEVSIGGNVKEMSLSAEASHRCGAVRL